MTVYSHSDHIQKVYPKLEWKVIFKRLSLSLVSKLPWQLKRSHMIKREYLTCILRFKLCNICILISIPR